MRVLVFLIILIATALRFYGLGDKELWGDEIAQAVWSQFDWPQLWQKFRAPPDLISHFALVHLAQTLGPQEFWTRLPSAFTSLLAVPLTYVLAKRMTGDRVTALVGMTLMAVAPYEIWYAQDARMYAALACYALVGLYFFVRVVGTGDNTGVPGGLNEQIRDWRVLGRDWKLVVGLFVGNTLALYTHLFGAFPIAAEGFAAAGLLGSAWIRARRVTLPRWLTLLAIGFILTILFTLPLAGGTVPYILQGGKPALAEEIFPTQRFQLTSALMWEFLGDLGLGAREGTRTVLSLALAAMGLGVLAFRKPRGGWIAGVWLVSPLLILAIAQPRHTVSARYLIFLQPVYLLLIGYAVVVGARFIAAHVGKAAANRQSPRRLAPVAAVLVVLGLLLLGLVVIPPLVELYPRAKLNDWRALARYIQEHGRAGDLVFGERNTPNLNALTYYLPNLLRYHTPPTRLDVLEEARSENRRIWYISAGEFFDPEGEAWARENLDVVPLSEWLEPDLHYAPKSEFEYTQSEHLATLYFREGQVPSEIEYVGRQGISRTTIDRLKINPGETLEAELQLQTHGSRELEIEFSSKKAARFDVLVNQEKLAQVREQEADKGVETMRWQLRESDATVQIRVSNLNSEFPLFIQRIGLRAAQ